MARRCFCGLVALLLCNAALAGGPFKLLSLTPSVSHEGHPQVAVVRGLSLGNHIAGGSMQVVVRPREAGAAVFRVIGNKRTRFTISMVGDEMVLRQRGTSYELKITQFRFGGGVSANGLGRLNRWGELDNVRMGATLKLDRHASPGQYQGMGRVRVTYY